MKRKREERRECGRLLLVSGNPKRRSCCRFVSVVAFVAMAEPASSTDAPADPPKAPEEIYRVVINAERQYSIWPDWKKNAPGWEDDGKKGTKQECLQYIEEVWKDMRPLSLQKFMAPFEKEPRKPIVLPPMPTDGVDHFHSTPYQQYYFSRHQIPLSCRRSRH